MILVVNISCSPLHSDLPEESNVCHLLKWDTQQVSYSLENLFVLWLQSCCLLVRVLELQVPNPQNSCHNLENASAGLLLYVEHLHSQTELIEHASIILSFQPIAATLVDVVEGLRGLHQELLPHFWAGHAGCRQLVEDMVVPLILSLEGDAGLLQEVVLDHRATDLHPAVEADLNKLAKTRAVVVSHCLGIT